LLFLPANSLNLMRSILLRCSAVGILLALASLPTHAQKGTRWCATDEHTAALQTTFHDPVLEAERAAAEDLSARMQNDDALARSRRTAAGHIVPTVIHVITPCGAAFISKQQILNGFERMSQDWQRLNPDTTATRPLFRPYASTLDVEFRLAQLDPQGNPTDGIERITSSAQSTAGGTDPVKTAAPYWPNCFNIWLVPTIDGGGGGGIILGYGQFPGTGPWSTWGFVMRTDSWTGAFGTTDRTASHEVGHCFNLIHSFTDAGGCGSGGCTASGDRVCDTPPQATATQGCNLSQNTCSNDVGPGSPYTTNVVDQIENFMSYDNCQNMFTLGQRTRVDAAFQSISYLQNLVSPTNLLAMGVADGQVVGTPTPIAYITTCQLTQLGNKLVVCQGQPVTLTDASYRAPVVSRLWTFTNATPATDTSASPTVVFNTPGRQTITLVVVGAGGVSSPAVTLDVQVLPTGTLVAPFQESFETPGIDTVFQSVSSSAVTSVKRWRLVTPTVVPGLVASDGQAAYQLQNTNIPSGTLSSLISPPFDTRGLATTSPQPKIKFDIAYAKRNTASADELRVYFSADCGRTWTLRYTRTGTALTTTTLVQSNFIPTSATQWRTDSVVIVGRFVNQPGVMVKFEGTSLASGNNLYLDNVRIEGRVLGLTADLASAGASLAPNPLTEETALRLSLTRPTRVAVRVSDLLGRTVLVDTEQSLPTGTHELPLGQRLSRPQAGVYVVTVTLDGQPYTQKLLVR
jgi:PKD repeat protein